MDRLMINILEVFFQFFSLKSVFINIIDVLRLMIRFLMYLNFFDFKKFILVFF